VEELNRFNHAKALIPPARQEIAGRIRGLDGMDYETNAKFQAFFEVENGQEMILFTESAKIQTLLEVAFSLQSYTTVVCEKESHGNRVLQVRFNRHP
jgi:hypothetical protein